VSVRPVSKTSLYNHEMSWRGCTEPPAAKGERDSRLSRAASADDMMRAFCRPVHIMAAGQVTECLARWRAGDRDPLERHALERLRLVPGIRIYGEVHLSRNSDRVGVIPFNLDGVPHALVAAILGYEGGIGVRNGCFCAQP
jgi:Aminotransferase class-V